MMGEFTYATSEQLASKKMGLFCFGWVRYLDIFKNLHPIVFCQIYDLESKTWESVGGSAKNYTD